MVEMKYLSLSVSILVIDMPQAADKQKEKGDIPMLHPHHVPSNYTIFAN